MCKLECKLKKWKFKKRRECYPSDMYLPHSKRDIYRTIEKNDNVKCITYQMADTIFDDYTLSVDYFHKDLTISCNFLDYTEEDEIINRKIRLNKKAAWMLIKDLIKYVLTGKI